MTFVKCNSHRARNRLFGIIGPKAQGYYSFKHNHFHGVYLVMDEDLDRARALKGITKCREQDPDEWSACWH